MFLCNKNIFYHIISQITRHLSQFEEFINFIIKQNIFIIFWFANFYKKKQILSNLCFKKKIQKSAVFFDIFSQVFLLVIFLFKLDTLYALKNKYLNNLFKVCVNVCFEIIQQNKKKLQRISK